MKRLILPVCCLALAASCFAEGVDEALPRNPFWTQGYEGLRYPITAEPRFSPEPAESAATNAAETASLKAMIGKAADPREDPVWTDARKALKFGSAMSFSDKGKVRAVITINGRVYTVGDLVSANYADYRFTWQIETLSTDGKIKLKRIAYRKIGTNP